MVLHKIMKIPSAEPERKTPDHGYMWICPECGLEAHSDFNRCVRCGWDRPSAERKKGRWIEDAESFYKAVNEKGGGVDENTPYFVDDIACSECLSMFSVIDNEAERFDFCPNCGADMRGACQYGDEIDDIYDAPTVMGWIPCSERLPDKDQICLVCGKKGGMCVARFWTDGKTNLWTKTGTGKFVYPIAWTELPEPYKGEQE